MLSPTCISSVLMFVEDVNQNLRLNGQVLTVDLFVEQ